MSNETWWWGVFLAFLTTGVALWFGWSLVEARGTRTERAAQVVGVLFTVPFAVLFWFGTIAHAQLVIR